MIELPSYLRDTSSVIIEMKDIEWSPEYKWATLDVAALYSNIPHDKGISAIRHYLSGDDLIPENQKAFILEGIQFILKRNIFEFDNQIFMQTRGTAMGSRFAPSFANLYMGLFESFFIQCEHKWKNNIVKYKRYIDDLIFVWHGTESDFIEFN